MVQLLLAPTHNFLEKVYILSSKVHPFKLVHIAQKLQRRLEGLSVSFRIIERIFNLTLELCYLLIESGIGFDDLPDFYELISLFIFDLAFPVLIELRKMQELEVSIAYL